jgi:hypothetical protein
MARRRPKLAKKKTKSKSYSLDFSGVEKERRQRAKRIKEGDYILKITKVERKKNKKGDAYYFSWTMQVVEDAKGGKKYAGVPFWYTTSLKPDALFNLRNLVFAATDGKKNLAGKKAVKFNPQEFVGAKLAGTVEDDEYEGKIKSVVADVFPLSELVEEEDEDEEDEESEDDDDSDDDDDDDEDDEEDDDEDDEDDDEEDDDEDEDDLDDVDDDDL